MNSVLWNRLIELYREIATEFLKSRSFLHSYELSYISGDSRAAGYDATFLVCNYEENEARRKFLLDWKYCSKLTVLKKGFTVLALDEQ